MMPTTRNLKFFPSQRDPLISENLPLIEAIALFLNATTARVYSAQFHHLLHVAEYFTEQEGPGVRLRACRPRKRVRAEYAAFRRSAGAHPAVIENELETLRAMLEAAGSRAYVMKPVAGVKP